MNNTEFGVLYHCQSVMSQRITRTGHRTGHVLAGTCNVVHWFLGVLFQNPVLSLSGLIRKYVLRGLDPIDVNRHAGIQSLFEPQCDFFSSELFFLPQNSTTMGRPDGRTAPLFPEEDFGSKVCLPHPGTMCRSVSNSLVVGWSCPLNSTFQRNRVITFIFQLHTIRSSAHRRLAASTTINQSDNIPSMAMVV